MDGNNPAAVAMETSISGKRIQIRDSQAYSIGKTMHL